MFAEVLSQGRTKGGGRKPIPKSVLWAWEQEKVRPRRATLDRIIDGLTRDGGAVDPVAVVALWAAPKPKPKRIAVAA